MLRYLIILLYRLKLLKFFNFKATATIANAKVIVPFHGNLGYFTYNSTEPWMTQTLRQLKPLFKGAFVDVGVNIGQTLAKAYAVYGKVNYTGFEPNAVCVHYVQDLIKQNRFTDCNLLPVGISDKTDILKLNFYYDDETDPSASIIDGFRPDQKISHSEFVPVCDSSILQSMLPAQQHPILKIDVEGAELEVLKGLRDWIEKVQPLILVEILPVYTADNHFRLQRQKEMETLLSTWNYRIARLVKENTISLKQLDTIGVHGEMEWSDYLLYPASLSEKVSGCFTVKQPA